jgi:hypothetical protein
MYIESNLCPSVQFSEILWLVRHSNRDHTCANEYAANTYHTNKNLRIFFPKTFLSVSFIQEGILTYVWYYIIIPFISLILIVVLARTWIHDDHSFIPFHDQKTVFGFSTWIRNSLNAPYYTMTRKNVRDVETKRLDRWYEEKWRQKKSDVPLLEYFRKKNKYTFLCVENNIWPR